MQTYMLYKRAVDSTIDISILQQSPNISLLSTYIFPILQRFLNQYPRSMSVISTPAEMLCYYTLDRGAFHSFHNSD